LSAADKAGRIEIRYQARERAFFVVAMTFDAGWRASLDRKPLTTYPTAACQLGVELPPGEHRLVLEYREPLVGLGGIVTLLALVGGLAACLVRGRKAPGPAPDSSDPARFAT
jgi:uncharacterized membrane protein YfhO